MRIGTAGWSIPRNSADSFPGDGQHLARYARVLDCAEINSSFYRSHGAQTYARWASTTPPGFRFSVKLPRAITHDACLRDAHESLQRFVDEVATLDDKLAVVLVQLPPSLVFDTGVAAPFFELLRQSFEGGVVCEPRHASWFEPDADALLVEWHVSRAAVDPTKHEAAAHPGGWRGDAGGSLDYYRWHGSPRMYWSRYSIDWLRERNSEIDRSPAAARDAWCIFDNTSAGAAIVNALELQSLRSEHSSAPTPGARSSDAVQPTP